MFARFEYSLSKEDYVLGLKAISTSVSHQDPKLGHLYFIQFALLGVLLVLASLLVPGTTSLVFSIYVLTLAVGSFIQSRFADRWRALTFDAAQSHVVLSLDDPGLSIRQPDIDRRYTWTALRRIHDLPEAVVLEMADWHAITMPAQLWSNSENRADFLAQLWARADQPASNLPAVSVKSRPSLLPLLGAGALALNLMIATEPVLRLLGIDERSCDFCRSEAGQLLTVVPFFVYAAAFAAAWTALVGLKRAFPHLANWLAIASIALFVALQAIPPMLQIYRFFSSPTL